MHCWRRVLPIILLVLFLPACRLPPTARIDTVQAATQPRAAPVPLQPTPTMRLLPTATRVPVADVDADVVPRTSPASCPVTQPPTSPFVPPQPWPAQAPYADEFWYGTPELWTMLRTDGTWWGLPHNPDGYTQKVFWWREGYGWTEEPEPALTATGRRLDRAAPPLLVSRATNAFHEDFQSAMLIGVDFPTLGCWEITGHYRDAELTFVVWVAP